MPLIRASTNPLWSPSLADAHFFDFGTEADEEQVKREVNAILSDVRKKQAALVVSNFCTQHQGRIEIRTVSFNVERTFGVEGHI